MYLCTLTFCMEISPLSFLTGTAPAVDWIPTSPYTCTKTISFQILHVKGKTPPLEYHKWCLCVPVAGCRNCPSFWRLLVTLVRLKSKFPLKSQSLSDGYSESSISENFIRSHLLVYSCFLSGKAINRLSEQELSNGVFFWRTVLATFQSSKILGSIISADCDVCATGAWLGLARYTFCLRPHPHELREGRLLTITYYINCSKDSIQVKKVRLKYYLIWNLSKTMF